MSNMTVRRLLQRVCGALLGSPAAPAAPSLAAAALPAVQQVFAREMRHVARRASASGAGALRAATVQYPFAVRYLEDTTAPIYNLDKTIVGSIQLPGDIFRVPVRTDIMHRVVRWQRARRQQGTHKAKNRAEVSGGGKKPWAQKKTGKARQGSRRAPHFVHGGIVHGPVPRSHAHELPKKVRRLGLKCALSAKALEGRLLVVDSLEPGEAKTKALAAHLDRLLAGQPRRSALLIDSDLEAADGGGVLRRAAGNLRWVDVVPQGGANVYGILRRDVLIMTVDAVVALTERLRRPINRLGACGERLMAWKMQRAGRAPVAVRLLAAPEAQATALPAGEQQQAAAATA